MFDGSLYKPAKILQLQNVLPTSCGLLACNLWWRHKVLIQLRKATIMFGMFGNIALIKQNSQTIVDASQIVLKLGKYGHFMITLSKLQFILGAT